MILKTADFFIGTLSGAAMAFCIDLITPSELNMFLGMLLGGLIGQEDKREYHRTG